MVPCASKAHFSIRRTLRFSPDSVRAWSSASSQLIFKVVPGRLVIAVLCAIGLACGSWHPTAVAAPLVTLDQTQYTVQPGQIFEVKVLIDGDDGQADIQALANGLYSYGWEMSFPSTMASATEITVVSDLDFWGFDPSALDEIAAGIAKAEGNIDQIPVMVVPYAGSLLATVSLQNLGNPGDSYFLQLALAPHFPTEQLFQDGAGNVLDDVIQFGSARVFVTPEPATFGLLLVGAGLIWIMRRRLA